MKKQGNVKILYMYNHPSTKHFLAKHNFEINHQKIIDRKFDTMQQTTYFLDDFSN